MNAPTLSSPSSAGKASASKHRLETGPFDGSCRLRDSSVLARHSAGCGAEENSPSASPVKLTCFPVGGLTPFTTVDFPGRLAAVLYTQGCAWRCRYCHNAHLWPFEPAASAVPWEKVLDFLDTRKGFLDGVVFCGGEPTAHAGLGRAMGAVKAMGFEVALHTTGMYPERLEAVIPLCDWVGMDVKSPFDRYEAITGVARSGENPQKSARLILQSGVAYEFRTTAHPDLLSESDLLEIGAALSRMGARHFALQAFHAEGCVDDSLKRSARPGVPLSAETRSALASLFSTFTIRH
ncbi:MAG: anaerobic ribonucleoside-triphosphate reductase activating protein [Candidatus Omnitrophica bacterium]|nr:anaerobic ribonucleoside-triphosphate reductase activating protein [Candidatus Omnitrophota bacterium]